MFTLVASVRQVHSSRALFTGAGNERFVCNVIGHVCPMPGARRAPAGRARDSCIVLKSTPKSELRLVFTQFKRHVNSAAGMPGLAQFLHAKGNEL